MECERILVPRSREEESAGRPRTVVTGTTHAEKQRFCDLEFQTVVIHLSDNPTISNEALQQWKAEYKRCQTAIVKAAEYPIELERAEALAKYPDLHDFDICRKVVHNYQQLEKEMAEAQEQGVKFGSARLPLKEVEKLLQAKLKAVAAFALTPDAAIPQHAKNRHDVRKDTLAHLDEIQALMKQKKGGGWYVVPNPLTIIEWLF